MRNKKTDLVLFDLDGTLLNPRKRLYSLFIELSGSAISYNEYWKYKDKGYNQERMLTLINYKHSRQHFNRMWMEEIERRDLLALDEVYSDVVPSLNSLKYDEIKTGIITNRQSYENLEWELYEFAIRGFFDFVVSTFQKCSKDEAIIQSGLDVNGAVFVGDSKEDIDAAEKLDIKSVLIRRECIKVQNNMKADYIIGSLDELKGLLS